MIFSNLTEARRGKFCSVASSGGVWRKKYFVVWNNENINITTTNNILIEIYKWFIPLTINYSANLRRYVSPDSIPAVMLQCCRQSVWASAAAFLLSLQFPPVLPALHTRMSYRSASRASISSHEKFSSASLNLPWFMCHALSFKITRRSILGSFCPTKCLR